MTWEMATKPLKALRINDDYRKRDFYVLHQIFQAPPPNLLLPAWYVEVAQRKSDDVLSAGTGFQKEPNVKYQRTISDKEEFKCCGRLRNLRSKISSACHSFHWYGAMVSWEINILRRHSWISRPCHSCCGRNFIVSWDWNVGRKSLFKHIRHVRVDVGRSSFLVSTSLSRRRLLAFLLLWTADVVQITVF